MDLDVEEYAGAPPLLLAAEQQDGGAGEDAAALSLEESFARVVHQLMCDHVTVPQALLEFKLACEAHAAQLRCARAGARQRRGGRTAPAAGAAALRPPPTPFPPIPPGPGPGTRRPRCCTARRTTCTPAASRMIWTRTPPPGSS